MAKFKYPVCSRCGRLLYGVYNDDCTKILWFNEYSYKPDRFNNAGCSECYHYEKSKLFKRRELWRELLFFESDINISRMNNRDPNWNPDTIEYLDYKEILAAQQKFNEEYREFFNSVVVNNPNYNPEFHEKVFKHIKWELKELKKEQEKHEKLHEEYKKKREAEKAYEATHPKPKCPTCGSTNVEKISTANRMVSVGMLGLASDKIGKQFCCKNCGYKW